MSKSATRHTSLPGRITELRIGLLEGLLKSQDGAEETLREALKQLAGIFQVQNCALFLVDQEYPERMALYADFNPNDDRRREVVKDISKSAGGSITSWCMEQTNPGKLDYPGLQNLREVSFHSRQIPDHLTALLSHFKPLII